MAKSKKNNVKKEVDKRIEQVDSGVEKNIFKILCIVFGVLLFLSIFYFLTIMIVSNDSKDNEKEETAIQYEKILAGSSFNMKDTEYLVVYYDTSDTELADLAEAVYNYGYLKGALYTVDMGDGFNKKYIADDKSNSKPEAITDLAIKGPTLIRFVDGNCVEYIEGVDSIISYLN